jgi:quinol monooxygenase YgiN
MAAGVVHIPWYATGFRADTMEQSLAKIAPVALRYGATAYTVYRNRDDRYKFLQTATFESKEDWDRYWNGPEFTDFRVLHSSYYQIPLVYSWNDLVAEGRLEAQPAGVTNG